MKRQVIKVPMHTNPLLSHAVRVGDLVFTSGEVAIDPTDRRGSARRHQGADGAHSG